MNQCKIFWLAVSVIFAILILCTSVIFVPIPETGEKYADMVIPFILGSGFGAIISMYFGTSEGSKTKNQVIANLLDKQADTPKPPEPPVPKP